MLQSLGRKPPWLQYSYDLKQYLEEGVSTAKSRTCRHPIKREEELFSQLPVPITGGEEYVSLL